MITYFLHHQPNLYMMDKSTSNPVYRKYYMGVNTATAQLNAGGTC